MSRDPIGLAMATMSRIASSSFVERMGLRTTIEKLTYQGTKSGFKALGVASRQFKSASQLLRPERAPPPLWESMAARDVASVQRLSPRGLQKGARYIPDAH